MAESPEWIPLPWGWTKNAAQSALEDLDIGKKREEISPCATFPFENKMNESKQRLIIPCDFRWKVLGEHKKSSWEFRIFYSTTFSEILNQFSSPTSSSPAYLGALQTLPSCVMNKSGLWTAEAMFLLKWGLSAQTHHMNGTIFNSQLSIIWWQRGRTQDCWVQWANWIKGMWKHHTYNVPC